MPVNISYVLVTKETFHPLKNCDHDIVDWLLLTDWETFSVSLYSHQLDFFPKFFNACIVFGLGQVVLIGLVILSLDFLPATTL